MTDGYTKSTNVIRDDTPPPRESNICSTLIKVLTRGYYYYYYNERKIHHAATATLNQVPSRIIPRPLNFCSFETVIYMLHYDTSINTDELIRFSTFRLKMSRE